MQIPNIDIVPVNLESPYSIYKIFDIDFTSSVKRGVAPLTVTFTAVNTTSYERPNMYPNEYIWTFYEYTNGVLTDTKVETVTKDSNGVLSDTLVYKFENSSTKYSVKLKVKYVYIAPTN